MADKRSRVQKILGERLTDKEKQLYKLMSLESRKDKVVFRMPAGLFSLEDLWLKIKAILAENNIDCSKASQYANLLELDEMLSDIKWLWKGWIPSGFVTLLAGDPGVGKSALALGFAKVIANGTSWPLSDAKQKVGNVVWIEAESKQQVLRMRTKSMGIERERLWLPNIDGNILTQVNLLEESHQEAVLDIVKAKKPNLIVLDSLGSAHNRGENRIEDVRPIMEFLNITARDTDSSVLVLHHLRKNSPGESAELSLYRVRGSTIITATPVSIIALEKPTDNSARIRVIKSNLSKPPDAISVLFESTKDGEDIADLTFAAYVPPASKRTKKEVCADWVMTQLYEVDEDGIQLKVLVERGEAEGYTRGNIYAARDVLGERIAIGGTGREAYWSVNSASAETVSEISESYKKNGR